MSDIAIRVEKLSKLYKIGAAKYRHDTLRDQLAEGLRSLFRRNGRLSSAGSHDDFIWALKDVSFEVKRGEVTGIIGRNGAGKSTLLKILSRITEPTTGSADIYGRVGSLLEVGTGFHGELTGRENIYLNAAILGMSKAEIDRKFDDIVDFSGVEKFIDTPVKRYSSGMFVRLAFAVAAHLEPEILIVDEVLAVGDAAFQKKCLRKMEDVARTGRTVLFVSHNMAAVEHLCHTGIMLQDGILSFSGSSKEAVDFYLRSVSGEEQISNSHSVDLTNVTSRRQGSRQLLNRLELFSDEGEPLNGPLRIGAPLRAHIRFRLEKPARSVDASLAFDTPIGQRVFTAHSAFQPDRPDREWMGEHTFVCEIPSLTLMPGEYKIKVALDIANQTADGVEDAARIIINESDYYGTGRVPFHGLVVLKQHWHLT
jgi:lipopolysaccharide transport system ATP-binding protein